MIEKNELQFDKAEFEQEHTLQCNACQTKLTDKYFTLNLSPCCHECKEKIIAERNSGSASGRFFKALGAGLLAAIAGSLLYFAVLKLTGYEIGLIAIAVGFMVGKAVLWGSDNRGGTPYRILAVALTYLAIVSTYVPLIFSELSKPRIESSAAPVKTPNQARPAVESAKSEQKTELKSKAEEKPVAESRLMDFVLAGFIIFGYILAIPFLAGFENIIGLLIIGFALYEAFKLTAPQNLSLEGPFEISSRLENS